MGDDLSDFWLEGDDGLGPSDMDGAPPRPAKGYVVVPLAWLERVRPVLHSTDRLLVGMVLYSQCLRQRSRTVKLPNKELRELGISRWTKQRALVELEEAKALTKDPRNGQFVRLTLHWFP